MADLDEEAHFDAEDIDNTEGMTHTQPTQVTLQPERETLSINQTLKVQCKSQDTKGVALRKRSGTTCFSRLIVIYQPSANHSITSDHAKESKIKQWFER